MDFPQHIPLEKLRGKREYDWDRRIANGFFAVPGERNPKLWDAFDEISAHGAYALGVACAEWAAARMKALRGDVTNALVRIEAGWVATLDGRAIDPSKPVTPKTGSKPDPIIEPVWMIELFLYDLHHYWKKAYEGADPKGVRGMAATIAVLARHVGCKKGGFDPWLKDALALGSKTHRAKKIPIGDEKLVDPRLFRPDFDWKMLTPKNPHLTDAGREALARVTR